MAFITLLLNLGFSIVQVQEWLGHGSTSTTINFYAHVYKSSKINIANTLDKLDAEQEEKEDRVLEETFREKSLPKVKKDPEKGSKTQKTGTKVVPIQKQNFVKC